jgi:lipooligosaccharide transport system permease protein
MAAALRAYEYWMYSYRRVWRGTFMSSLLNPVLYLTALGVGLGKLVNRGGTPLGVPYLEFVAPGMLAATAMQIAAIEGSFPIRAAITWTRSYHGMLATPLRVPDLIVGHLLYVATRVAAAALVYLGVIVAFGAVHSWAALFTPLVAVAIGLAFAAPVSALSARAESEVFNPLFRFVITPMFLFSGTFFPVTRLPHGLRELAYATPLWHGVAATRSLTLGTASVGHVLFHVAYLLAFAVVGFYLSYLAHRKKLVT